MKNFNFYKLLETAIEALVLFFCALCIVWVIAYTIICTVDPNSAFVETDLFYYLQLFACGDYE